MLGRRCRAEAVAVNPSTSSSPPRPSPNSAATAADTAATLSSSPASSSSHLAAAAAAAAPPLIILSSASAAMAATAAAAAPSSVSPVCTVEPDLEGARCKGPIDRSSCEKKPEDEGESSKEPPPSRGQRCQARPAAGAVAARSRLGKEGKEAEGEGARNRAPSLSLSGEAPAANGEFEAPAAVVAGAATAAASAPPVFEEVFEFNRVRFFFPKGFSKPF